MAEPRWTPEAEAEVARAPFFIRRVAKKAVLRAAEEQGVTDIDLDFVRRVRAERGQGRRDARPEG